MSLIVFHTFRLMQKDVIRKMVQEKHGYAEIEKELQKQFGEQAYKRTTIY